MKFLIIQFPAVFYYFEYGHPICVNSINLHFNFIQTEKNYITILHHCTPSTALYTTPDIIFALTCEAEEQVKEQPNWTARSSRLVSGG
jgi:hypothetical protein